MPTLHNDVADQNRVAGRCRRQGLGLLLAVLLGAIGLSCALMPPPAIPALAAAALAASHDGGGSWQLSDRNGDRWGLTLFTWPPAEAGGPADNAGWRLRLTARSPRLSVQHGQPLELTDGLGQHWTLPNRSDELVTEGAPLPASSAQFDLAALQPRPNPVLPLQLQVSLQVPPHDASEQPLKPRQLTLPADLVATLSALPRAAPPATAAKPQVDGAPQE